MAGEKPLTLMAVHAHPDDEASSTGGVLARYAEEGLETIVVTCTNGALGDAPGGVKPDEEGFDEDLVVATRRVELEEACAILGVGHLELLHYGDSGMMGWSNNEAQGAFWQMPVEQAAEPLVALMRRHRPDVVVTYDENGAYGHPDHIQAHRITLHAAAVTGIPAKIYYTAIPRSTFRSLATAFDVEGEPNRFREGEFGTPDELLTTRVDCSKVVHKKRAALAAHSSQTTDSFFFKLDGARFDELFGIESFVRHLDRTGTPTPESDLFEGLR